MNAKTVCESDSVYRLRALDLVYGLKRGTRGPLLEERAAVRCSKSENGCEGS